MARKDNWNAIKAYMNANKISWTASDNEDEDITNARNAFEEAYKNKAFSEDVYSEGLINFRRYDNDKAAELALEKENATAENTARRQTAYNEYLNSRVASYLGQLQAQNGQQGYGQTAGQAVALANNQAQAQQDIIAQKAKDQQSAYEAYQALLRQNAADATDQMTSLSASRDQKAQMQYNNYLQMLDDYVDKITTTKDKDGNKIPTEANIEAAREKINNWGIDADNASKLNMYLDTLATIADKKAETTVTTTSRIEGLDTVRKFTTFRDNNKIEELNDTDKALYQEKERTMLGSDIASGGISSGNTCTLTFQKDSPFVNNDTTVTFRWGNVLKAKDCGDKEKAMKNLPRGQAIIYNDKVYVCKGDGTFRLVCDYAGEGAYERLYDFLKNSCYDFTDR